MIIVSGHLLVEPARRTSYLEGCVAVVSQARGTAGCLDFALSADLVDPGRINIYERWDSQAAVDTFRGSGPSGDQQAEVRSAVVSEYDVGSVRVLSGPNADESPGE